MILEFMSFSNELDNPSLFLLLMTEHEDAFGGVKRTLKVIRFKGVPRKFNLTRHSTPLWMTNSNI